MKTADTRGSTPNSNEPPNGTIDQRRVMFYSGSWQLLEERIDDTFSGGSFSENRRVQYIWGIRGSDDIVLRRADSNFSGTTANYDKQFYHLTDPQFSTIVILDETAKELERITYDAYGRPIHHQPAGDLTGSGHVVVADAELWTGRVPTLSNGGRGTIFDLNRDGSVDEGDRAIIINNMGQGLPWGALSFGWIDNHLGFAGYHYHPEMRVYLARHRWFDPELGRWLQRDPAGYVDGMNLYLYASSSPFVFVDPMGLWPAMRALTYKLSECNNWLNPWTWGEQDQAWEEMMRARIAQAERHLDRMAEEGTITDRSARQQKFDMHAGVNNTMDASNLAAAEAQVQTLETGRDATLTAAPAGALIGAAQNVVRTAKVVDRATDVTTTATNAQRMARARQAGQAGEDGAGIVRNTRRIESATGTAAYRTPDQLNHAARQIGEVKNVSRQAYTAQLSDMTAFAQRHGYSANLYVRQNTVLTRPLQRQVDQGSIILHRILHGAP